MSKLERTAQAAVAICGISAATSGAVTAASMHLKPFA
jgi:hypothetical protein